MSLKQPLEFKILSKFLNAEQIQIETENSISNIRRNQNDHSHRLLTENRVPDKMYNANDLFKKIGSSRRHNTPMKNTGQIHKSQELNNFDKSLISSRSEHKIRIKPSDYSNHHLCYSHSGKNAKIVESNPQIRLNLREIKREIGQEKTYENNLNKQIESVKNDYFNQLINKTSENKSESSIKKKKIFQNNFMKKHYPQITEENQAVQEKKFEENLEQIKSHEIIINPTYERWEETRKQFLKYKIPVILEDLNNNLGEVFQKKGKNDNFMKNKYKVFFE
jgi:hypothetical protein